MMLLALASLAWATASVLWSGWTQRQPRPRGARRRSRVS